MLFIDYESFEIVKVVEFLEKFLCILNYCELECGFFLVFCICNGQVYFYIIYLSVFCQDYVKLFFDNDFFFQVVYLFLGQLFLKFLKIFKCFIFRYFMKGFGVVIKDCNNLECVKILNSYGFLYCFLE